jgi:hypothetical protein
MAEIFALYRFTKLTITWLAPNGQPNDVAMGVVTGVLDNVPTSVSSVVQLEYAKVNFGDQTTPTILHVPRSYLVDQAPNKWWKTLSGAPQDWDEIQGVIFGATTAVAFAQTVVIDYEIEFCDFVNPANTPLPEFVCVDKGLGLYKSVKDLKGSDEPPSSYGNAAPVKAEMRGRVASERVATTMSDRKS